MHGTSHCHQNCHQMGEFLLGDVAGLAWSCGRLDRKRSHQMWTQIWHDLTVTLWNENDENGSMFLQPASTWHAPGEDEPTGWAGGTAADGILFGINMNLISGNTRIMMIIDFWLVAVIGSEVCKTLALVDARPHRTLAMRVMFGLNDLLIRVTLLSICLCTFSGQISGIIQLIIFGWIITTLLQRHCK